MADFTFTSPTGQSYTVTGPEGATAAQAFQMLQQHLGTGNNPAQTKQAGYQTTDTGQFTPIQNAGQKAPEMTGNPALGAFQGASNTILGAGNAMAAGAYATLKPHSTMAQASDNFDQANQFLQGNQIGPSADPLTEGARQAVMGAASKLSAVPQQALEPRNLLALMGLPSVPTNQLLNAIGKTQTAQKVSNAINQSPALVGAQNALSTGSDVAGNTVLPAVLGATAKVGAGALADTGINAFKQARDLGYSIMPSEAAIKGGSAPVGKLVEGLAGSAKTGVSAVMKNQPITNGLAATDISATAPSLGITSKTELTPQILDQARAPNNAVYAKVSSLGRIHTDNAFRNDLNNVGRTPGNSFPGAEDPDIQSLKNTYNVPHFDAADAVLQIRNLRKNATANYKASAANQVKNAPMLGELADAQQGIADALENQLDRFVDSPADKIGNPKLVQDWRQARKNLAIINTVDNSIKEGTTDVSAEALAKQLNRGAPLSGNLQKIADMQNNFPISIRDVTRVRNKVPINALEGIMGTSGAGAALLGQPHLGAGLITGMVARPIARAGLLSNPYQSAMLPKSPIDPIMMRALLGGLPAALNAQGNKQ